MIAQTAFLVFVVAALVVAAALVRGVVRAVAQRRAPAPAQELAAFTRTSAAELTFSVASLLEAYGIDPATARVRHDPTAVDGVQWRVRVHHAGSWCFGAGSTPEDAVAELASCADLTRRDHTLAAAH